MRAIFLDVDGVLNQCAASGFGLQSDKLTLLDGLVRRTGAYLVLSSSWRTAPQKLEQLELALADMGHRIYAHTPDLCQPVPESACKLVTAPDRWVEIQVYLKAHPEFDRYVILDDLRDMGLLAPFHVRTHSETGLTPWHVEQAFARLTFGPR